MPNQLVQAARRMNAWSIRKRISLRMNAIAGDLMRLPDERSVWPRYLKATDPDSSFYVEYSSGGGRQSNTVVHDGKRLHNLAVDNLMSLPEDEFNALYRLLTDRAVVHRTRYLQRSEDPSESATVYAPGTRRP